ncbi:MAG: OmpA family protein [Bacteroidetes bacterium]|nr:OmpA family protein [Bacteroidota bacterium]MBU1720004.1 OmpA family protein [Bacteroidota bacterium]
MKNKFFLFAFIAIFAAVACVPVRKYDDLKTKKSKCDDELSQIKSENQRMVTENTEMKAAMEKLVKQVKKLEEDTFITGTFNRRINDNYNQLNKTYELLMKKYEQLLAGNATETEKLTSKIQESEFTLQKKEDELKRLQKELETKEYNLKKLEADLKKLETDLNGSQAELLEKQRKVNELQTILAKKDSTVKALKDKVSDALLGFKDKGLSVDIRNGKVYVSMDESLLFATGSWQIGTKGVEALKELAKVLETNPDINVLVEGHTDNVAFKGANQVKDNWDLSVMRATAVVKIITQNSKVDPKRLMASGRSEFLPIDPDNTKEAQAKNRRTEIILTPKLDELLKIIESN